MRKLTRQGGWRPTSHRCKPSARFGHVPEATLRGCHVSAGSPHSRLPQLTLPLWSVVLRGHVLGEGQGAILWGSFASGAFVKEHSQGEKPSPELGPTASRAAEGAARDGASVHVSTRRRSPVVDVVP